MKYVIEKLSVVHTDLINSFTCVETAEELNGFKSKIRKRIKAHSLDMENFIKEEALEEQERLLNTTHLFIDEDDNKLIGYISLCADSVHLDLLERADLGFSYMTIPAVKIARLAVSNDYKHQGFGGALIEFGVSIASEMQEDIGAAFITLDCYEHRISYYEKFGFVKNVIQTIQLPYDSPISMRLLIREYLEKYDITND